MRTFIRVSQTLLILAFFLPFVRVCSTKMTKSSEISSADSLIVEDTISLTDDTTTIDTVLIDSSLSMSPNDSIVITDQNSTTTKQSIAMNILGFLACPDYMNGLVVTGFGYSSLIVINIIEGETKMDIDFLINFLISISFILSIILLFISFRKVRRLTILVLIGFSFMVITLVIFIFKIDLCDILFGFWIALVLYFLNVLLIFMGLKKKFKI